MLIDYRDDGYKYLNKTRTKTKNYEERKEKFYNILNGKYSEFEAILKDLNINDEMCF